MSKAKQLRIKLIKSISGRLKKHQATIACLGLKKIGQTVERQDTPVTRGMVNKVNYLLEVEEV